MTNRVSIAYINNFPGPTLGGGEVQLLALIRGVRKAGIDVTLLCAEGSELQRTGAEIDGVRVVPIDFGAPLPSLVGRVRAVLRGIAIVQGTGFLTNLLARQVGPSSSARVVNTVQVVPGASRLDGEPTARSVVREMLDRMSRRKVDCFIAVSNAVGEALERRGIARERIVVIPNGIDVSALRAAAASPPAQTLRPAMWRIGYAGRLEPIKGCEYFVRASAVLAAKYPNARFFVAGTGSLSAELQALASRLGVADRLDFLGHVESVAPLLAASNVIVVPSLSEAFGLTAVEALALSVPVVATSVGGLPDIVLDDDTGLLVPPADAEAIATAVALLLDDAELAQRLGSAGAARVNSMFTVGSMVQRYAEVYGKLLAK